jgi:hypothetical protein
LLAGDNIVEPETLIAFSLRNFDNIYFDFEIQTITFGTIFAAAVLWLRYTYLNNKGSSNAIIRLMEIIRPKITATRCLFIMWAICSYKQFFDLDLLRYFHDSGTTDPIGRERGYNFVLEFKNLKIGPEISFPNVYDWLPLFLQAILAFLLFVYLISLSFSFPDLCGSTKQDNIISLNEVYYNCKKLNTDNVLNLTLRQKQLEEQVIRNLNSNN